MSYHVEIELHAQNRLRAHMDDPAAVRKVIDHIYAVIAPRPHDCAAFEMAPGEFRARYGRWRIYYRIDEERSTVTIDHVGKVT